ncbi:trans-aconitate 2-methyltransferase [Cesiribacter sp. SM1]|uniref:class I SAM-dependent methyltransferase n=1 Tax=Cesiribacter sp. SM1 TaxID=2861196 RepID=UPI001CD27C5A|nr:class I SAM-dependent methyltransferase [Cesiribacter sp. SM1]
MKASNQLKSTTEEIRERFDADVERFSNLETGQQSTVDAPLSLELIAAAARAANPHATKLLDVGCGAGNYTIKMLGKIPGLSCTLVDLSMPMLQKAEERVIPATSGNVKIIQADVRELELPENEYDIIVAGAVLHHLRDDAEWEEVFGKLYISLRQGGSLWISDLIEHGSGPVSLLFWQKYGEYLEQSGGAEYREKVLAYIEKEDSPRPLMYQLELLKKAGFRQIEVLHKHLCFAAFGGIK